MLHLRYNLFDIHNKLKHYIYAYNVRLFRGFMYINTSLELICHLHFVMNSRHMLNLCP